MTFLLWQACPLPSPVSIRVEHGKQPSLMQSSPDQGLVLTRMLFSWMPAFSTIFILIPDRFSMLSSTFLSSLANPLFGVKGTNITAFGSNFCLPIPVTFSGLSLSLSFHSFLFSFSSSASLGLFLNHALFPVSFFKFLLGNVDFPFL